MPRWQMYEVNVSDDCDSKDRKTQVKFDSDQEMAGDSPNLEAARYARRSASPVSSASTAGTSSSCYSGGEVNMTKRKETVEISSARISSNKDAKSARQSRNFTAICGWICACILGTVALIFVLLIYLLPTEGIFPVSVQLYQKSAITLVRQGSLNIYPGFNSTRFEHTISLDPADAELNGQEILDVVKSYPVHIENELLPPPYIHCWLNNPSRNQPCFFHEGWLGELCSAGDSYGYNSTSPYLNPCFLLRIEGTGDWRPEPLRVEYIGNSWRHEYDPAFLGVGCRPKEGDRSSVTFEKRPIKGFSVHYFPMNDFSPDLYLTPAVMIQVKGVPRNINVTIKCWIRTHNSEMLTDNGDIIINFVHKRSSSSSRSSAIRDSSSSTSVIVNTPRLVQATHQMSSTNAIPTTISLTTISSTTGTSPTVNNSDTNANFSVHIVDSNETSDYSDYDDDGGGASMPPM